MTESYKGKNMAEIMQSVLARKDIILLDIRYVGTYLDGSGNIQLVDNKGEWWLTLGANGICTMVDYMD